jgi:hypothetical protein
MFDDICNLVNEYTSSLDFLVNKKLQSWESFLHSVEGSYLTWLLRPYYQNIRLHDGTIVTVPVFDIKEMLTSLLTDQTIMVDTNFADGYDVLTGDLDVNNPTNDKYGEVCTGDAWIPARDRYCSNPQGPTMSVGLIVFGDKSHTNLHGTLSLTLIIFTLTLFNRTARNNTGFWRPIGCIPNLLYGKGTADRQSTSDKIQDKHTCLSCILESLCRITRQGGFDLCVLGRNVTVKIWIHYFIGDTEGNNKWLGQYMGNHDGVKRPYCDCKCSFQDLKNTNSTCVYITLEDIQQDNIRKQNDDDGGKQYFKSVSHYNIKNAFLQQFISLSDNVHGPFRIMLPELLHTSGSGLIMSMFESLCLHLGGGID